MKNYYQMLGVHDFANFDDLITAFERKRDELFKSDSPLASIPKLLEIKAALEELADSEKRKVYDEKLEEFLKETDEIFSQAIAAISEKDYEKALELLNQCIKLNPGEPSYYDAQGLIFRLQEKYRESIAAYRQGLATGMQKAFFNKSLAEIYTLMQDQDNAESCYLEAIEGFKTILETEPGEPEATEALLDVYMATGFKEEALEQAQILLKSDPDNCSYLMKHAIASYRIDDYEKAEQIFEKLLQAGYDRPAAYLYIGLINFNKRLLAKAAEAFEKSLELAPQQKGVAELSAKIEEIRKRIGKTVEEITDKGIYDFYTDGYVKWYNDERGLGMAACKECPDVLLHYTAIPAELSDKLKRGDLIKFGVFKDEETPVAVKVELISSEEDLETLPGKIFSLDRERATGLIKGPEDEDILFSFSELNQNAAEVLTEGLDVIFEAAKTKTLDDKFAWTARNIRLRKPVKIPS